MILRGESTEPDPAGNLFLTNIQQLYETREQHWTPQNAIEAILGRSRRQDLPSYQRSMLERLKELKDLVVLNDEAHHVHDEDLAWSQSLLSIHRALPKGLGALARLLRHAQRSARHVLPLDSVRLPASPGGGRPDCQGPPHCDQ